MKIVERLRLYAPQGDMPNIMFEAADTIEQQAARITALEGDVEALAGALRYYRDECSGNEPSLSVFHRMLDEALRRVEKS